MKSFFRELCAVGIYKRNQGRISRQVTFAVIAITFGLGFYTLSHALGGSHPAVRYGIPGILFLVGVWIAFRLVNLPSFTDFLIAVEAEMNKVTWPTRTELFRGSAVVLITIIFLAAVLYFYDALWSIIFKLLHITS